MTAPSRDSQAIAQRLIAEEIRVSDSSLPKALAAFRVCEKLRRSLSTLAGVAGFRSVMARALTLATAEVPWLSAVEIHSNGSLIVPTEIKDKSSQDVVRGGAALVTQLVGLLVTFIGETLTLRLAQNVWPKLASKEPAAGSDSHEKKV
jgi:hypothetical protein